MKMHNLFMIAVLLMKVASSAVATQELSPQDQEIIDRCKENILDAHGLEGAQRNDSSLLGALGIKGPAGDQFVVCEGRLAQYMQQTVQDLHRELGIALIASRDACHGCTMKVELHCREGVSDVNDLGGKTVGYQPLKSAGAFSLIRASYEWIVVPWIEEFGGELVPVSAGEIYSTLQRRHVDCVSFVNFAE